MALLNRYTEERIFGVLMRLSLAIVLGALGLIVGVVAWKGGRALLSDPAKIVTAPGPRYLLGGDGGFLHAILGSLYIVIPATIVATALALATALYLQSDYSRERFARGVNLFLDILWGTPSIVFGVFVLTLLISLEQRASVVAGAAAIALLEFPIITRYMDESLRSAPTEVKETTYSLGATRFETARVVVRLAMPGVAAGVIMGLARGIGDAAALLFTAGGSVSSPTALDDPATAMPILIFQQATSAYPSLREDAYAAALVLILLVLALVFSSRALARRFSRQAPRSK